MREARFPFKVRELSPDSHAADAPQGDKTRVPYYRSVFFSPGITFMSRSKLRLAFGKAMTAARRDVCFAKQRINLHRRRLQNKSKSL
jgi:hypothetical protein